jgi:hypothetical protein
MPRRLSFAGISLVHCLSTATRASLDRRNLVVNTPPETKNSSERFKKISSRKRFEVAPE